MEMDNGKVVALVLLNMSAAFDTIDPEIMLDRLQTYCGVTGNALDWFRSYLSERKQYVSIRNQNSDELALQYGVPQGSILGPLLFTIYTMLLAQILQKEGIQYHMYADDNQDYIGFKPIQETADMTIEKVNKILCIVETWLQINKLKLNGEKTEYMLVGMKGQLKKITAPQLVVAGHNIEPSTSIRNLGAYQDETLSMKAHATNIVKRAHYHLHNLTKIRKCLDEDTT